MSCNCGCNTCETKIQGPLLTEGKVKSLLSEGLQYHIDKQIPLFETVYRIGSDKHLTLIKEARKMYSRNIIDLCEEDEALIKTHLGEFALYEGEPVPLDLPMLEEEVDNSDLDNAIYRLENVYKYLDIEYKETRRGEKFIQINYIPVTSPQSQNPEFVNVRYNNDEDIEMIKNRLGLSVLNESYDYDEVAQSEFGMDYDQLGSGEKEWVRDEIDNMSMNEDIYDKFLDNPSSPKGRAKSLILKFTKEYGDDASSMAVDRFASKNNLKPEEKYILKYITKNDIKISSQSGGPDFSALNESQAIITFKNDYEVKMNTGEGYDDDFEYFEAGEREQVYILDKNDKRVHVEFGDGTNAFIPTSLISIQDKSLEEAYSGFRRGEPEDPDSEPFNPTGAVAEFKEDLRALFGKFKGDLKNPEFIKGVAQIMVNWKPLLRSQLDEAKKKKEKKDPPLNKPKRGGSKAYYVYVRDPKTKKIKKVSFGSGGLRAKIKNKEARNAFAARHNCKDKKDRTKAGYWSCNLPRYASALGLGANMNTYW
jgi:hypothetical protein